MPRRLITLCSIIVLAGCGSEPQQPASDVRASQLAPRDVESLAWKPTPFNGVSIDRAFFNPGPFFLEFAQTIENASKDQFETTAEFEARMARPDAIAPFDMSAEYFFRYAMPGMRYDADRQAFLPITPFLCYAKPRLNEGIECVVDMKRAAPWVGTDYELDRQALVLIFPESTFQNETFTIHGGPGVPFECPVPIDAAKKTRNAQVQAGVLVSIREPKLYSTLRPSKPLPERPENDGHTVGIPVELKGAVCFNSATGEVLGVVRY